MNLLGIIATSFLIHPRRMWPVRSHLYRLWFISPAGDCVGFLHKHLATNGYCHGQPERANGRGGFPVSPVRSPAPLNLVTDCPHTFVKPVGSHLTTRIMMAVNITRAGQTKSAARCTASACDRSRLLETAPDRRSIDNPLSSQRSC